ncbi:putative diphthamide synthesis protein-domain-containing protein [Cyathus striatus]|nr:putative diphthamide synthesis protein-domain-containing protein [Cyathus striatus]
MPNDQTTSFAASGEDAITRSLDVQPTQTQTSSPATSSTTFTRSTGRRRDTEGDYNRIALQFPDQLLHDAVPIFRRLNLESGQAGISTSSQILLRQARFFLLVDEVAAQHVDADAMVHYGHACMSLSVLYPFFLREALDVDDCVQKLIAFYDAHQSENKNAVLLKHDVVYTHLAESIRQRLESALAPRQIPVLYHAIQTTSAPDPVTTLDEPPAEEETEEEPSETKREDVQLDYTTIFYVGPESLSLTNLLMTNASCDVISYNPSTRTARLESGLTNKLLMRRYALVQKAKDADVVGILVGTLGVASYLPLIKHLRTLLTKHRKKSYTISVGKLNPAKLANFLEIECFVLVACPENSVVEAKEFLRPIVTPFELDIALQTEQSWTGRYVLDFGKVIAESREEDGEEKEEEDPDQPIFSLITGTYRHAKRYGGAGKTSEAKAGSGDAVVLRNQESAVAILEDSALACS